MFSDWICSTERLLDELRQIDLGYPLDENVIRPANSAFDPREIFRTRGYTLDDELVEFFRACDGISWPDVHNGYFVGPLESIENPPAGSSPEKITGAVERTIVQIGSGGGGALFAADCTTGGILVLPTGRIVDNVYEDSDGRVLQVSDNMAQFAKRLALDLKAFVHDSISYQYLE